MRISIIVFASVIILIDSIIAVSSQGLFNVLFDVNDYYFSPYSIDTCIQPQTYWYMDHSVFKTYFTHKQTANEVIIGIT